MKKLSLLQMEIKDNKNAIEMIGYIMAYGLCDIDSNNESQLQTALTFMLVYNEKLKSML